MNSLARSCALVATLAPVSLAAADSVSLTPDLPLVRFAYGGQTLTIQRPSDPESRLPDSFTKTARPCPPFCIQPLTPAPGITSYGELELLSFLESDVATGKGLLIDARLPEWFAKGSIPGAINLPFTALDPANDYLPDLLIALGAAQTGGSWDFSSAYRLVVFGNGAWSGQAHDGVLGLIAAGYPVDKIGYYRAGMQGWHSLGLTVSTSTADINQ